jgi:hypothetical protein
MGISEFTLRLALLFLPGLISFLIVDRFTVHNEFRSRDWLVLPFLLGFFCYLLHYGICQIPSFGLKCSFVQMLTDKDAQFEFDQIVFVAVLAIPIGLFLSFLINHNVLFRLSRWLGITRKHGRIDVWSFIMNSKEPQWIVVRDTQNDILYDGWVAAFSDGTERDELLICDVKVYVNSSGEYMYDTPGLYLPTRRENLTIEFPRLGYHSSAKTREERDSQ